MGWKHHNKPPMGWPLDYDSGLVPDAGFWYMPEGSGDIIQDLSGNGKGSVIVGATWGVGTSGSCLVFNANRTDYVNTSVSLTTRNFTIICQYEGLHTGNSGLWQAQEGTTTPYKYVQMESQLDDDVVLYLGDGANYEAGIITDAVGIGNFAKKQMIAWTVDGGGVGRCYVNGIYKGQKTFTKAETAWTLRLGSDEYVVSYYKAFWYSVYNRALSASEVAKLYQYPFWMFKDPDEIPILDQYYTVSAGGIMTPNTGYWGAI